MAREDKEKKSKRYATRDQRSQTVETAELSSYGLELEAHSFLIVHADVRHNMGGWELHDCVYVDHRKLVTACGPWWD